jgi:uncharacterized protein
MMMASIPPDRKTIMSRHFASLAYTARVRDCQRRYAGRDLGEGLADTPPAAVTALGPREQAFIAERDSFYLATVGETGWPHVQHRGGPPGFLQVLDATTLAFADYSGNRQYVSVGNLAGNDRAALILMDYPNQRRLKIMARVELVDSAAVDSKILAKMKNPEARVERVMRLHVAAYDWNCSQHITPRYTESEWREHTAGITT